MPDRPWSDPPPDADFLFSILECTSLTVISAAVP